MIVEEKFEEINFFRQNAPDFDRWSKGELFDFGDLYQGAIDIAKKAFEAGMAHQKAEILDNIISLGDFSKRNIKNFRVTSHECPLEENVDFSVSVDFLPERNKFFYKGVIRISEDLLVDYKNLQYHRNMIASIERRLKQEGKK